MNFIQKATSFACFLALPLAVHAEDGAVLASLPALLLDRHQLVTVDGDLQETVWQDAPEFGTFHQFLPENGKPLPPGLRTTVRLLIDGDALIFGIRAWDGTPASMRSSLARRDKVAQDQDFIGIWLDPTGHGRAAQFVRVNIDGVLSDGMYRADEDEDDLGPDFPIDAAVRRLPDGYSMEIRWPMSNLRFPYEDGKTWRLMVERSVPHAGGLRLTSTPLKTGSLSYIDALQEIGGMAGTVQAVRDRSFLELKPELTVRANRDRDDTGRRHANKASAGLEINARPRADWVFNATLNPDFSQVEIDEPMPTGASRIALSLPEKRGFFLESADVLGLTLSAFYSRTIASPQWGLRATWRNAQADATAVSLRDEEGGVVMRGRVYETAEYTQTRRTLASMARARWHGDGMLLGAFVSQRGYGDGGSNEVAGFDGQWRGNGHQASWLLMHSQNSAGFVEEPHARTVRVPVRHGSYAQGRVVQINDNWWNEAKIEAIGPGFVNDNGFVPQAGVVKTDINLNRRLGEHEVPFGAMPLKLYEFEAHLGLHEIRTLSDATLEQQANEIVERKIQPGIWFRSGRQTDLWANLGFDRQRARGGASCTIRAPCTSASRRRRCRGCRSSRPRSRWAGSSTWMPTGWAMAATSSSMRASAFPSRSPRPGAPGRSNRMCASIAHGSTARRAAPPSPITAGAGLACCISPPATRCGCWRRTPRRRGAMMACQGWRRRPTGARTARCCTGTCGGMAARCRSATLGTAPARAMRSTAR
ncbi:hypothetical protein OU994_13740 [Pseudoduganella sp. SL102]|uniref:hypothetical protein n=1 Tax=Pseudoduganella sp. SL102 TaxID=2995154 RepID=UPI00248B5580|nr:hypothetical protein [Pseudoduganella sp. SL102]WBS05263.1 hypothetical protein OU994_13740 [Pseudoduganella sp. SL102]